MYFNIKLNRLESIPEQLNKLRFTPEDLAEILKCTKVKDLNELFELLRTGKLEDYIDLDKVEGLKEKLELWEALLGKAHLMNPSDCTLTKEEKVAILMAIKPIADKMDDAYDKLEVEHPFIKNVFGDLDNILNIDAFNKIEKEGFAVLSINNCMQNILGFNYRAESDSYYTQEGSLQNQWGFCDYMDDMGNMLGMNLDTEITTFNYDGQEFRVQLWKGNYGWQAAVGGEFGLYSRPEWEAKGNPYVQGAPESELILYDCVEEKYQLPVKQETTYKNDRGHIELFGNNTATYGDGTHYWNLNIRTEAGITKESIGTRYEIDCSGKDIGFQEALYQSLASDKNIRVKQEGRMIEVSY